MSNKNKSDLRSLERIYELKELFLYRLMYGVPSPAIHLNQAMSNRLLPKANHLDRVTIDINNLENR